MHDDRMRGWLPTKRAAPRMRRDPTRITRWQRVDFAAMSAPNDIYDAAVIGGGIVGSAAALGLAAAGRRVTLIERTPPALERGRLGFDIRTVAVTPAAVAFMTDLLAGDDTRLPTRDMAPIRTMKVWEFDGAASLTFEHRCALAQVVENSVVTTGLWDALGERVDVVAPASVVGIEEAHDRVTVTLERAGDAGPQAASVSARLVIAADGGDSVVRSLLGVPVRRETTPHRALATIAATDHPHANTAWQRFGPTGPVALLPLREECAVAVIWSTSASVSARLTALDDTAFVAALTEETEAVTGGFAAVDRRVSFPLRQSLAADLNPTPRTLIIGDAARTLHPLAGQGVNVGLEDAKALADQARAGGDLGAPGRWRTFSRVRRQRSKAMMALMRALLAAYSGRRASTPWMRLARNTVVRGIDASPMIKAQLIREALGLGPFSNWSLAK